MESRREEDCRAGVRRRGVGVFGLGNLGREGEKACEDYGEEAETQEGHGEGAGEVYFEI